MTLPIIGITMGDPAGIGPEVSLQAVIDPRVLTICRPVIFGNSWVLSAVRESMGLPVELIFLPEPSALAAEDILHVVKPTENKVFSFPGGFQNTEAAQAVVAGRVDASTGQMSFQAVNVAIDAALAGHISAVVTGPIHKEAWQAAGIEFPGHTEVLADRTDTEKFCMMMTAPEISCSLVTCHVGLADAMAQITTERIVEVIRLTHESRSRALGRKARLLTLGLNPHAGEGGLFGNREEEELILPAIARSQANGIDVDGPVPPDTAFVPSKLKQYDAHICMYHDQGLIPFKALAFETGVNVTLGLPIVRTSVDHGTALDIARQGKADISSMIAAIELAVKLAGQSL